MNLPLISVIIPLFNRKETISRAIDSVLGQTTSPCEIIVLDDGSTDDAALYIEMKYQEQLKVVRQKNRGVSAARNNGVSHCQGDYIAFLDSDDQWKPEKLEKQLQLHLDQPDLKISQTQESWIRNGTPVKFHKRYRKPEGDIFDKSLELCTVSPSSVFMKRSLFEEYGGFDEAMPSCEDFDLWLRISSKEKVGLIDEALMVKYGGDADQLSSRYPAMDRFRIYALLKIWFSDDLTVSQREEVVSIIRKKINFLCLGAVKRNKDLSFIEALVDQTLDGGVKRSSFMERAKDTFLNEQLFS